jgi:hypothetical protein
MNLGKKLYFFGYYGSTPLRSKQIPYVFLLRSALKFPLVYPILGADNLPILGDFRCSLS